MTVFLEMFDEFEQSSSFRALIRSFCHPNVKSISYTWLQEGVGALSKKGSIILDKNIFRPLLRCETLRNHPFLFLIQGLSYFLLKL